MGCTQVWFNEHKEAESTRRSLLRDSRIFMQTYHCDKCDKYHLKPVHPRANRVSERDLSIARSVALGLTTWEIARDMAMPERTVEDIILRLRQRLFAVSGPNLVAIMVALGFIDPNEFIPGIEAKLHA